ncbi:hypothetical protein [Vibrio owensii]|uniref:hypothetical protein n=1 Tax=Vibrio harveyi group TaxID=717610 RepID=UPI003CC66EDA
MQLNNNSKFTLELPRNDAELNELIHYHMQFTSKYYSIAPTGEKSDRFRDYICESLLGMTNGGYQQLQSIWKEEVKLNHNKQMAIDSMAQEVKNLPDYIFVHCPIDLSAELCIKQGAVKMNNRGIQFDDEDFDTISEELEFAIYDEFEAMELFIEYPRADRHGVPDLACDETAREKIAERFGINPSCDFKVSSYDMGSDNCETIIFALKRR